MTDLIHVTLYVTDLIHVTLYVTDLIHVTPYVMPYVTLYVTDLTHVTPYVTDLIQVFEPSVQQCPSPLLYHQVLLHPALLHLKYKGIRWTFKVILFRGCCEVL